MAFNRSPQILLNQDLHVQLSGGRWSGCTAGNQPYGLPEARSRSVQILRPSLDAAIVRPTSADGRFASRIAGLGIGHGPRLGRFTRCRSPSPDATAHALAATYVPATMPAMVAGRRDASPTLRTQPQLALMPRTTAFVPQAWAAQSSSLTVAAEPPSNLSVQLDDGRGRFIRVDGAVKAVIRAASPSCPVETPEPSRGPTPVPSCGPSRSCSVERLRPVGLMRKPATSRDASLTAPIARAISREGSMSAPIGRPLVQVSRQIHPVTASLPSAVVTAARPVPHVDAKIVCDPKKPEQNGSGAAIVDAGSSRPNGCAAVDRFHKVEAQAANLAVRILNEPVSNQDSAGMEAGPPAGGTSSQEAALLAAANGLHIESISDMPGRDAAPASSVNQSSADSSFIFPAQDASRQSRFQRANPCISAPSVTFQDEGSVDGTPCHRATGAALIQSLSRSVLQSADESAQDSDSQQKESATVSTQIIPHGLSAEKLGIISLEGIKREDVLLQDFGVSPTAGGSSPCSYAATSCCYTPRTPAGTALSPTSRLFDAAMLSAVPAETAMHPVRAGVGRFLLQHSKPALKSRVLPKDLDAEVVERLFFDSMPRSIVTIDDIKQVISPELLRRFLNTVSKERGAVEATFHGTKPALAERIVSEGLSTSICQTGAYGDGAYVGTHAGVAHQYADPDEEGRRYMCLILVLAGSQVVKGQQGEQPLATALDNLSNPTQYCFVDEKRLLVSHLIVYRAEGNARKRIGGGFKDLYQTELSAAVRRAAQRARKQGVR